MDTDNETTHQCRRDSSRLQLDRAELRHLDRDRYNAATDNRFTVTQTMTSPPSHGTSHLKRAQRKIDESRKAATEVVVNERDDFDATNAQLVARDGSRSTVTHQQRTSTIVNIDGGDDRTTASTFNMNMNANMM